MGSDGSSLVGKPSSSTSGGWGTEGRGRCSTPESLDSLRERRMGGGAASSESESLSCLSSEVSFDLSTGTLREWAREKLKKLQSVSERSKRD